MPRDRKPAAAFLWIHGGGYVVGTPAQDDARCVTFARELGMLVVSPEYRLSPRHPFPAAHDDCLAAWRWTVRTAEDLGIGRSRVAMGGGSAGGGLAACLTQRLRDENEAPPASQLLVYPMLDDRTAVNDGAGQPRHLVWNRHSNFTGWSSYLAGSPGAREVPRYSVAARRDDLSGLPPAWIGVGTLDLFLEEDRTYAHRLEEAGVPCRFHAVEGGFHGFDAIAPESPVALSFVDEQVEFLRTHLFARSGT
jgi:acetyl esterase/lipase